MKSAFDIIKGVIFGFAEDAESLSKLSLAEHDKIEHPNGFDKEHDTCKFRDDIRKMTREDTLFAASDIHSSNLDDIDPADHKTILLAGDIMGDGYFDPRKGLEWLNNKFIPWCKKYSDKNIVIVPGNHDITLEMFKDRIKWPDNVEFLDGKEATVNGLKVYGTPWCRYHAGGAYEVGSERLKEEFDKIPEGVDVLITHTPPHVKGEKIDYDKNARSYFGSEELTEAILKKKPKLVICGHVHTGSHKPIKIGDTTVVNVSVVGGDRMRASYGARSIGVTMGADGASFMMDTSDDMRIKVPSDGKPSVEKNDVDAATEGRDKGDTSTSGDDLDSFFESLRDDRKENAVLLPDSFIDFYFAVVNAAKEINKCIDRGYPEPRRKYLDAVKSTWPKFQEFRKANPDNPMVAAVTLSAWEIAESARKKFKARIGEVPKLPTAMGNPYVERPRTYGDLFGGKDPYGEIHGITDMFDDKRKSGDTRAESSRSTSPFGEVVPDDRMHIRLGDVPVSTDRPKSKPIPPPKRTMVGGGFAAWARKHCAK